MNPSDTEPQHPSTMPDSLPPAPPSVSDEAPVGAAAPAAADAAAPVAASTAAAAPVAGGTIDLYRAALGPLNVDWYLAVFARFDARGRTGPVWNPAAALGTLGWMLFRRLWVEAVVYAVLLLALVVVLGWALTSGLLTPERFWLAMAAVLLGAMALPGWLGTGWLHADIRSKLLKAASSAPTLWETRGVLSSNGVDRRRQRLFVLASLALLVLAVGVAALLQPSQTSLRAATGAVGLAPPPAPAAAPADAGPARASPAASEAVTSGSAASGAAASGPVASGSVASGSVTSGSAASGAAASGPVASGSTASGSAAPAGEVASAGSPLAITLPVAAGAPAATGQPKERPAPAASSALTAAAPAASPRAADSASAGVVQSSPRETSVSAVSADRPSKSAAPAVPAAPAAATPGSGAGAPAAAKAGAPAGPAVAGKDTLTAPLPVLQQAPARDGFAINVGLYAVPANADRVVARLQEVGLPTEREEVPSARGPLSRVRVGPFDDPAAAEKTAAQIRSLGLEAQVFMRCAHPARLSADARCRPTPADSGPPDSRAGG